MQPRPTPDGVMTNAHAKISWSLPIIYVTRVLNHWEMSRGRSAIRCSAALVATVVSFFAACALLAGAAAATVSSPAGAFSNLEFEDKAYAVVR